MTYPATRCFLLEPTDRAQVGLRRYVRAGSGWTCADGYHQARVILGDAPLVPVPHPKPEGLDHWFRDRDGIAKMADFAYPDHADPRWPATCESCDYRFVEGDEWQHWSEPLLRRADTGELTTLRAAPPGAMWNAWWYPWKGADGRCIVAKCPNGQEWVIDSRARNCTLPDDTEHRCWVRHGEPPNLTVDKNGLTCAAGAGSIQADDYHGFLRDGFFTAG